MKLHFPNSAFLGNIDTFIRSIDTTNPAELTVSANKHWMSLHPVVLCMAYALALQTQRQHGAITCEPLEATNKHYLQRMGLLHELHAETGELHTHEASGRFIPLTQINDSDHLGEFITDMIPLLHSSPEQVEPVKYVVSELVRNVFEHADSPIGGVVCAQFFKKTNRVSIGVVDYGIGIQTSLQQSHNVDTDAEALRLALTPGITGLTSNLGGTESNAGAGLFFIKSIAKVNRDFFLIYSGTAMFKLLKTPQSQTVKLHANPLQDRHSIVENLPFWPGTVVGIDLTMDQTQKFDVLLELIREVYRLDVREHKKERLKQPRFI
jgi:anti-sigma regulatory factor (Ser/Thr protein kinase)